MLTRRSNHAAFVCHWLDSRVGMDASADRVESHLIDALQAIWWRSRSTLGDVTLGALFKNVLDTVAREYPILRQASIEVASAHELLITITMDDGDDTSSGESSAAVALRGIAARSLLIELLSVLGHLTAETLTPGLHEALTTLPLLRQTAPSTAPSLLGR